MGELKTLPEPKDIQVVVLMGGLGTRLGTETRNCPKALIDVNGKPFFDYQLKLMSNYGFQKFLFLTGHMSEQIKKHYGDGSRFGVSIRYSCDGEMLLGTGGSVKNAFPCLEEDFLLLYGDSFMDIDYRETIYRYFRGRLQGCLALMTVLENWEQLDRSNVFFEEGKILLYDKQQPDERMRYIDYGVGMYHRSAFEEIETKGYFDIAILQKKLSLEKKLAAHEVTNRFYEIGSSDSLNEFRKYAMERFDTDGKAVFFDRDGVINEIVFCEDTEQLDSPLKTDALHFIKGVTESLRMLQEAGFYLFIVTNQPAAAKGKVSLEKLYDINTELCKRLKALNIYVNAIEMCPHYPQRLEHTRELFLIRQCQCRKPKSGLIESICKRFRINREKSWMVGDSYTDILAGQKAGLQTAFLGDYKCDVCRYLEYNKPDWIGSKLMDFSQKVITGKA